MSTELDLFQGCVAGTVLAIIVVVAVSKFVQWMHRK